MIIIADTETTSLAEDREVIELAFLKIDSIPECNTIGSFRALYKPLQEISLGAMNVHNIIEDDLVDALPSAQASLPENVEYLIGHNIDFDWESLGKPSVKRICTLAMAQHVWQDLETHKLSALIYHLMPHRDARKMVKDAHSALSDCQMTSFLLQKIIQEKSITSIEELYEFSERARIPLKMTFGKHRNERIKALPASYKSWLLTLPELDQYLRIALTSPAQAQSPAQATLLI